MGTAIATRRGGASLSRHTLHHDAIFIVDSPNAALPRAYALEAFDPSTNTVSRLGAFNCSPFPEESAAVTGLAVDRSGGLYAPGGRPLDGGAAEVVGDGGSPGTLGGLTGTGDGRLFMLGASTITEVDPTGGSVVQTWPIPNMPFPLSVMTAQLAFWAGDLYMFAWGVPFADDAGADDSGSGIVRFRPSDGTSVWVAMAAGPVAAAAVSTCAPLH